MPRATCRCGQILSIPDDGTDRVVCPKCGARVRIRVRRDAPASDGFIRFFCPCGRKLKVSATKPPSHGKCPDCGRVVPVPARTTTARPPGHPEADTDDLGPEQRATLERWAARHGVPPADPPPSDETATPPVVMVPPGPAAAPERAEVGMRVCPNCRKPVHLGADACRACGTPVPRK